LLRIDEADQPAHRRGTRRREQQVATAISLLDGGATVLMLRAPIFEDKVIDFIVELAKIVERKFTPQEPGGNTRLCRRRCVTELTRSEPSAARAALPRRP